MQVLINSNHSVHIHEDAAGRITATIEDTMSRFADRVTRVEVHLSDENSRKGGDGDKRCLMETRIAGLQPIAVSHHAETLQLAIDGATDKLARAVEDLLGKQRTH